MLACFLLLAFISGCGPQDATPKTSHFEHDHEVAEHWPSDLADAATKIRERLGWIDTGEVPEQQQHEEHDDDDHHDEHHHEHDPKSEIVDLVAWVPEVAADTNLSESDWLPLHHASDSLMANLNSADDALTSDNQSQIESFCNLIDVAVQQIPKPLSSLQVTTP